MINGNSFNKSIVLHSYLFCKTFIVLLRSTKLESSYNKSTTTVPGDQVVMEIDLENMSISGIFIIKLI